MRIQTNIAALNAYRNLTNTDNRMNRSLERLSSGYRINRAADDAAGLSISEKMRGQIRGLNQAARNAQDGISLIQTAEGSLNETHAILQRMRELAVQAANDTLTASDRTEIQKEIDQLRTEIDRIANTTEFNTKKLLDGTTSALASTDNNNTKVFMRDGLRVEDQFGQKAVGGGNFRLDIQATPGTAQIQKTDIFKIKHEGAIVEWTDVEGTQMSPAALQAAMKEYEDLNGITINLIEGEAGAGLTGAASYNPDDGRVTLDITIAEEGNTVAEVVELVESLTVTGGLGAENMVQNVRVENAGGGTFTLGLNGEVTDDIDHNASVIQVQNRLQAISALEGNVEVTGTAGNWNIEFINDLTAQEVNLLTIDPNQLDGPNMETIVSKVNDNFGGQSARLLIDTGTADAGTFTLSIEGFGESSPINYDAEAQDVADALQAMGITAIAVTGPTGNAEDDMNLGQMAHVFFNEDNDTYNITLQGILANQNIEMTADLSALKELAEVSLDDAGTTQISDNIVIDFSGYDGLLDQNEHELTLHFGGQEATFAYNASVSIIRDEVWDALETAGGLAEGAVKEDVVVVRDNHEVTIDFVGALARQDLDITDPVLSANLPSGMVDTDVVITSSEEDLGEHDAQLDIERNAASGGTFTLALDGFGESGPINFSRNAANLQENIQDVLVGMVATSGAAAGYEIRETDIAVTLDGDDLQIEFIEGLGNLYLNPYADLSNLEYNVADASAVQQNAGQTGSNLTYELYITGAGGGTFVLDLQDSEGNPHGTGNIAWNATADQVRQAIENLDLTADPDAITFENNVEVTGKGTRDNPWVIEFINDLSASDSGDIEVAFGAEVLDPLEPEGNVEVSQEAVAGAGLTEIMAFNVIDGDHEIEFNPNTYTTELNEVGFREGLGEIAQLDTAIYDIDRFWDASGNFLVDEPQTITLVQGDGTKAAFTIFRDDTIGDVVDRIDAAIRNEKTNFTPGTIEAGKGLGQGEFAPEEAQFAYYVEQGQATEGGTFDTVEGTIVINSAIAGGFGEIQFVGDEEVIKALSLTTIREAQENRFTVDVVNAHSGGVVAEDVTITSNVLVGVVHSNVDVEFDPNANIAVGWQTEEFDEEGNPIPKGDYTNPPNSFNFEAEDDVYQTYVHLADNTMVFHIGANPLQDVGAAIGDMRARALGVHNTLVMDRDSANDSIAKIDRAIERVSAERSKLGALQNRLEHTISNLAVASENLSAAESRIRDVDMAAEMMEFTKNQILAQAGTAMLAQANMKPQMVLQLLG